MVDLEFEIKGFKSIEEVSLKLAPLTLLIGPPAGGKSNILDSLAFVGYINRLLLSNKEYNGPQNIEPPGLILRFNDLLELLRFQNPSTRIFIKASGGSLEREINVELYYEGGVPKLKIDNVDTSWPWTRIDFLERAAGSLAIAVSDLGGLGVEARLYGFDRYGLSSPTCTNLLSCGMAYRVRGENKREVPKNVLSELVWNITRFTKMSQPLVLELNDAIREGLEERVEIKVGLEGEIRIYDYDVEVLASYLSDAVLRVLYYGIGLRSLSSMAKVYGLEGRAVACLEEPGAHVFPYLLDVLAKEIAEATKSIYVVIATHNPLLASILNDRVRDARTYYVYRDQYGATNLVEVDLERMAKDLRTFEDLMSMPPAKVTESYAMERA